MLNDNDHGAAPAPAFHTESDGEHSSHLMNLTDPVSLCSTFIPDALIAVQFTL